MPGIAAITAVVVFEFDPVGTILGFTIRWQYVAVAGIIFAALLCAGVLATVAERRRRARLAADPERPAALAEAARAAEETVRASAAAVVPADTEAVAPGGDESGAGEDGADEAAGPEAPPPIPIDPLYTGWTPGHTVPHVAAAAPAGIDAAGTSVEAPEAPAPPDPATDPATAAAVAVAASDPAASSAPPDDERPWPVGLRLDDLLFIVAAATAGAVVFGRLGWVLLYLDWYRAHTDSILDSAVGGLTLAGGVVGGVLAGLLMAFVLGAPVARWLGVAVAPLLAALAAGKIAMVLGGAGQGLPYDGPWATAFAGPGPWASLAPMIPSYPAQIYEAVTSAAVLVLVLLLALVPSFRRHPAALFAVGIGGWALGRFAVSSLWRDPTLVAGLNGDQVVTAAIAAAAAIALVAIAIRARLFRRRAPATASGTGMAEGTDQA